MRQSHFLSVAINACHCEPVLTLAWPFPSLPPRGGAPRSESKSNNCQWQLLNNVKVARASPASARRMRDKTSLAEQGERQSPPLRKRGVARLCRDGGDCTFFKGVPQLPRFDNPSVKNQRFLPAPFTQGSLWVLPHQCICRCFLEEQENCTTFVF